MATNEIYKDGSSIPLTVGTGVAARSPVSIGGINGVTLTATDASSSIATVRTHGIFDVNVHSDNDGSVVTAVGDLIYLTSGDTPVLNRKTTGTVWGVALEGLSSGVEGVIKVRLISGDSTRKAANVGSSTATAATGVAADLNTLLAALKAAGLMTADA